METNEEYNKLIASVTIHVFLSLLVSVIFAIAFAACDSTCNSKFIVIAVVMSSGFIGSLVGFQRQLNTLSPIELKRINSSRLICLLTPLVGGILALLLYLMFLSGFIQGDLFPKFIIDSVDDKAKNIGFHTIFNQHGESFRDYAKLIFWCFLAGFSEKFVTNIIKFFEESASTSITTQKNIDDNSHN